MRLPKNLGDRFAVIGYRHWPVAGIEVPGRIDPERGVNGSVKVRHRDRPLYHGPAEIVGLSDDFARPYTPARQYTAKRQRLMSAASTAVELGRTAELRCDDDERGIQHAVALEVGD